MKSITNVKRLILICAVAVGVYIFSTLDARTHMSSSSRREMFKTDYTAHQSADILIDDSDIGTKPSSGVVLTAMKRVFAKTSLAAIYSDLISSAPPGSKIIDIGLAHAKECFGAAKAQVHCTGFEANPITAKSIQEARSQNVNLTQYSKIIHAAVGSEVGEAEFLISHASGPYAVGSYLGKKSSKSQDNRTEQVVVPMVSLDSVFGNTDQPFFMLKSDTQGHELGVLQGARQLFKKKMVKFVFIEMAVYLMPNREKDSIAIIDLLNENGFVCFDLPSHDPAGNRGPLNYNTFAPSAMLWTEQNAKGPFFTDIFCELTS